MERFNLENVMEQRTNIHPFVCVPQALAKGL